MNQNQKQNEQIKFVSDDAVLLKKMRLLRRLNRRQAALLFDFSYKYIEKLENGRGTISKEKLRQFQEKYGFSDNEVEAIREGKMKATTDANSIRKRQKDTPRKDRRFCHRRIEKESKVLKQLRLFKGITQYEASKLCNYHANAIGYIENGRISLDEAKILHIVTCYGQTMELYSQLMKAPFLRYELIEQCTEIILKLEDNKLSTIHPLLVSMNN